MKFIFKSELIDYEYYFKNKTSTIVFLHGWGGDKNSFCGLEKFLKNSFNILKLTMPTTSNTLTPWTLFDYCNLVENLIVMFNIKNVYVVCHSFGFRVAMLLNKRIKFCKIIITGGAGIFKENLLRKITTDRNKIILKNPNNKHLFNLFASNDYKQLSNIGKKTFKNVINLNLKSCLKFDCPVLLFWGKKDTATKPWIARKIKHINKCKLIMTNSDHFAYIKDNVRFCNLAINFFNN